MTHATPASSSTKSYKHQWVAFALMVLILGVAPIWVYPVFLMKVMCFALFACAFNLLLGFGGLLSFGHAMFLGSAGYVSAHAAKVWGWNPELCVLLGTFTSAVLALIEESYGVAGLHLNGDVASWTELRTGGRYEDWLFDFDQAVKRLPPNTRDDRRRAPDSAQPNGA